MSKSVETLPRETSTGTVKPLKAHILARPFHNSPQPDKALCGYVWDRLHPKTGDLCRECLSEFKRRWPNARLPL